MDRFDRVRLSQLLAVGMQRLLAWTTTLLVALSYRGTLARGGFSIGGFCRACATEFAHDIAAMNPRRRGIASDASAPRPRHARQWVG